MSGNATPRSRWAVLLYAGAALIGLLAVLRAVAFVVATANFELEDLWELVAALLVPVFLALIVCALAAGLQYLFDIRAAVLLDTEEKRDA